MHMTLYPYLKNGCWVFDDPATGLKEEAFVLGMTEMISRIVEHKDLPDAAAGISLAFSADPFADHDAVIEWQRPGDGSGNWYAGDVVGRRMEGWLCPALFRYFRRAPRRIFVRCDPLPEGVNPIWNDGGRGRRYVGAGDR